MERELVDTTILAALKASGARIEGVVVAFLQRTLRITQVYTSYSTHSHALILTTYQCVGIYFMYA